MKLLKPGTVIHKHYAPKRDGFLKNKWHLINFLIYWFQKKAKVPNPNLVHSARIYKVEGDNYIIAESNAEAFNTNVKFGIAWFHSKLKEGKWVSQEVKGLNMKLFEKAIQNAIGTKYGFLDLLVKFSIFFLTGIKVGTETTYDRVCSAIQAVIDQCCGVDLSDGGNFDLISPGEYSGRIDEHNERYENGNN